jgi:hypothetical protein
MHGQCPLWVISGQTVAGQNPPLSAVTPIADIRRWRIPRKVAAGVTGEVAGGRGYCPAHVHSYSQPRPETCISGAPGQQRRTRDTLSAFDTDRWPLEMAVTWLACGDRQTSIKAAALAAERREFPTRRLPTLGSWLVVHGGLAQRLEAVDGAFYRKERREGWVPGLTGSGTHPISSAIKETARQMTAANIKATGCQGNSPRSRIPRQAWKSASIVDDRKLGLILKAPKELPEVAWRQIDVSAEPFKRHGAKRGRRPAGLSDGARSPRLGVKTNERLRTKENLRKEQQGDVRAPKKRGGGRPTGSPNIRHR